MEVIPLIIQKCLIIRTSILSRRYEFRAPTQVTGKATLVARSVRISRMRPCPMSMFTKARILFLLYERKSMHYSCVAAMYRSIHAF